MSDDQTLSTEAAAKELISRYTWTSDHDEYVPNTQGVEGRLIGIREALDVLSYANKYETTLVENGPLPTEPGRVRQEKLSVSSEIMSKMIADMPGLKVVGGKHGVKGPHFTGAAVEQSNIVR